MVQRCFKQQQHLHQEMIHTLLRNQKLFQCTMTPSLVILNVKAPCSVQPMNTQLCSSVLSVFQATIHKEEHLHDSWSAGCQNQSPGKCTSLDNDGNFSGAILGEIGHMISQVRKVGTGDTEEDDLEIFLLDDLSYCNVPFLFCFHSHTYFLAGHGYLM